ncbi:response regulator [Isoalcanivorax indicus]|uniref:response regulator n=1 Tax=Isoalcanivorax indicus TaxID=2202653 RepID=UPI0013C4D0F7|nr:response regulator [Isoalcanivorax indicus]
MQIQPYFHPTTIVMLDDNQRFLENFSLQLDESLACLFYSSPVQCLEMIKSRSPRITLDQRCFSYYTRPSPGQADRVIRLDLTLIEQEISNAERFRDISVVVVDYDMPEMNGVQFCERLRGTRIKKILLTGVADEKIAVRAFNEGIIDQFMLKNDPHITQRINSTIQDLQRRYFQEVSMMIQNTLALEPPDFIYDPAFIEYFFTLTSSRNIVEYYYVEDPHGFLLVSMQGHLYRLVINNASDLERHLFTLKRHNAPASLIRRVTHGKALPWLWSTPEDYDDGEIFPWNEHVHDAIRIDGVQTWYCALVDSPPADIEYDSATSSYINYLESLDTE